MIETISDYNDFKLNCSGDWIVHVVPMNDVSHTCNTAPCILFIRVISSNKTYWYSFNHPDSKSNVSSSEFLNDIVYKFKNIKWAIESKLIRQFIPLQNVYDVNLCGFLRKNEILNINDFDTVAHRLIKNKYHFESGINKSIPLMKHLEVFNELCESIKNIIYQYGTTEVLINENLLYPLGELEKEGIFVDPIKLNRYFNISPNKNNMVYSQYNLYTSTGRPSNRFDGINYAALNSKNGCRECFVSRYGSDGKIVMVDYTAFHPRIICMLTKYNLSINTNIYEYLSKLYFQKKDVDDIDISNAKAITFRQLYGRVENKYSHIKYLSNLKSYIDNQWKFFKEFGYVETPIFKRKILNDIHITDANPTKLFNYILQAVEGEIAIPQIKKVQEYLKNKLSKAILYTYDSILYDFHKNDGHETLEEIVNIMSMSGKFPVKIYMGKSYQELQQIS